MRSIADDVLCVASARHRMPWTAFKQVFDELHVTHQSREPVELVRIKRARQQVVRNLDSLGHCDFDFSSRSPGVYAAPPVLARLPYGGVEAVLCGARAPGTIARLSQAVREVRARCEVVVAERGDRLAVAPARILVRSGSVNDIESVAKVLGIAFLPTPPAWLLANFALSLRDVSERLRWQAVGEPNWPFKDFDARSYGFRVPPGGREREQTRVTSYRDPRTNQYLTLAWTNGRCADVDRDWARYWVLQQLGRAILRYDERRLTLSVPAGAPLPALYARALTLCSGHLPDEGVVDDVDVAGDRRVSYRGVPPQIAQMVCAKLGQQLG